MKKVQRLSALCLYDTSSDTKVINLKRRGISPARDYQSAIAALPLRHAHSVSSMKRAGQPSGGVSHMVKFKIAAQNRSALTLFGSFNN